MNTGRNSGSLRIAVLNESIVRGRLVRNALEEMDDVDVGVFRKVDPFTEFLDTEARTMAIVAKDHLPLLASALLEQIREGDLPTLVTAHEVTQTEAIAVIHAGIGEVVLFPTGYDQVTTKVSSLLAQTDYKIRPAV